MEIKEFIVEALTNITDGVKEANSKENRFAFMGGNIQGFGNDRGNYIQFDIALATKENSKGNIGGELGVKKILVASISGNKEMEISKEHIHRIQFKIFVRDNVKQ